MTFVKIEHNVDLARPYFLEYCKQLAPGALKWIQYKGYEVEKGKIYFLFKSSQNSLRFKVGAGLLLNPEYEYYFRGNSAKLYEYFKSLKTEYLSSL